MSKNISLPEKFRYPTDPRPLYQITAAKKGYKANGKTFPTASEAYDYVERELGGNPWWESGIFKATDGKKLVDNGRLLFDDDWIGDSGRLLFNSHPDRELDYLNMLWEEWLQTNKNYKNNPKDFYTAYYFLNTHPMFWTLEGKTGGQLFWETANGLSQPSLWHTVYYAADNSTSKQRKTKRYKNANKKDGLVLIHLLEHGPVTSEPFYVDGIEKEIPNRIPSHDIWLDTIGFTYEEAIIKLAAKVFERYNKYGEQRKRSVKADEKQMSKFRKRYKKEQKSK